jgi:AhpD family alkylhydroperoxidase
MSLFPTHTLESAPAAARRTMAASESRLGYLPVAIAKMATAPQVLDGFLKISAIFETTTLDPLAREVLIMTMAVRNGCHLCVAMHSAKLAKLEADPEIVEALREQRPLADERLEAIRVFTLDVLATAGAVSEESMRDFQLHGYTTQNALEVVLGIGAYTLSTFANRMTGAPIDEQLAAFA